MKSMLSRFVALTATADPDECWQWKGYKNKAGYGHFRTGRHRDQSLFPKSTDFAHRVAWVIANRMPIPPETSICHTCDNPSCVNPKHLLSGSRLDNTQDMIKKTRHSHGEKHPTTVLSTEQVRAMRTWHSWGETAAECYRRIGKVVSYNQVCMILRGDSRKWE